MQGVDDDIVVTEPKGRRMIFDQHIEIGWKPDAMTYTTHSLVSRLFSMDRQALAMLKAYV